MGSLNHYKEFFFHFTLFLYFIFLITTGGYRSFVQTICLAIAIFLVQSLYNYCIYLFISKLDLDIFLPHDTDIHSLKIMITGTQTLITSSITTLRPLPEPKVLASQISWARSSPSMALGSSFISSTCSSK